MLEETRDLPIIQEEVVELELLVPAATTKQTEVRVTKLQFLELRTTSEEVEVAPDIQFAEVMEVLEEVQVAPSAQLL
jgi:hypothetical protein